MKYLSAAMFIAVITPLPLLAQGASMPTTPAFERIVRLAQEGYGDSARTAIRRVIDRTQSTDPSFPEALYTAATVSNNGEDMRLLFSRVAVEYSASAWADDALLRLAQLDYGAGNPDGVLARVHRLMNDYPASSVIPAAALWGSRAAFERRQAATACGWLTRGVAAVGTDVEFRSQLEFARTRCTEGVVPVDAPLPPDTARGRHAVTPRPPATPRRADSVRTATAAPRPAGAWRVQVGAFKDASAIRRTLQLIERAGFTAYQIPGPKGLTKIQAGPFATRDEANAKRAAVEASVNGDGFVTRVP